MKNNELGFMQGFRKARQILIAARQIKMMQIQNERICRSPNVKQNKQKIYNHQDSLAKKSTSYLQNPHTNSTFKFLQAKINSTGEMLQELQTEIQTYQIIFQKLCQYYQLNSHIPRKNNQLKQQSNFIHNQIQHYKELKMENQKQQQNLKLYLDKLQQYIKIQVIRYLKQITHEQDNSFIEQSLFQITNTNLQNVFNETQKDQQGIYPQQLVLKYKLIREQLNSKKNQTNNKKGTKKKLFGDEITHMIYDDEFKGFS